ncbi:MAG: YwaF family protein [Clostridia bacterium]|nr:YwaF family protein [Clostridia bacterium]
MHTIFGTKHLIIVAICLLLIIGGFLVAKKWKEEKLLKVMFYIGLASETIKIFYYIIQNEATHGGALPKTDLPFHLCSIQILFVLVLNFSKNEKIKSFLRSFMYPSCLIGGAAAILIATNSSLNGTWVITTQYFVYHCAIMVMALHFCTNKERKLMVNDYFNCLKFLVILMFVSIYINSMLYDGVNNINFMYVVSPPQSGLPFLNENHGWLVYIIHYACLILICVTLCYIKPIIVAIKQRRISKKQADENAA